MAIRDFLLPRLAARFAALHPILDTTASPVAVFPAVHPDAGAIRIWDDGDEDTVAIGDLTHSPLPNPA